MSLLWKNFKFKVFIIKINTSIPFALWNIRTMLKIHTRIFKNESIFDIDHLSMSTSIRLISVTKYIIHYYRHHAKVFGTPG